MSINLIELPAPGTAVSPPGAVYVSSTDTDSPIPASQSSDLQSAANVITNQLPSSPLASPHPEQTTGHRPVLCLASQSTSSATSTRATLSSRRTPDDHQSLATQPSGLPFIPQPSQTWPFPVPFSPIHPTPGHWAPCPHPVPALIPFWPNTPSSLSNPPYPALLQGTNDDINHGNLTPPGFMALHPTLYDYLKRRLNHLKSELPRVLNEINELEQLLHTPVSLPATPAKPSRSFLDGAHAPLPEKPSPPGVESAPKPSIQPSKRCRHNPQLQAHQDPTLERLEVIGQHTSAESHATPKMS